jgi:hypothetical protein
MMKLLDIATLQASFTAGDVDTAAWQPKPESVYDDWLKAKVAASLVGLQDGTNKVYSPEEWAEIRAARGWDGRAV